MTDGTTIVTYRSELAEDIKLEFNIGSISSVVWYINKHMTRLWGVILNDPESCKCIKEQNSDNEDILIIEGDHDYVELEVKTLKPWPGGFAFE